MFHACATSFSSAISIRRFCFIKWWDAARESTGKLMFRIFDYRLYFVRQNLAGVDRFSQGVAQNWREIFVEVIDFFLNKARVEFGQSNLLEIVAIDDRELFQNVEHLRRDLDGGFGKVFSSCFHLRDFRAAHAQ